MSLTMNIEHDALMISASACLLFTRAFRPCLTGPAIQNAKGTPNDEDDEKADVFGAL